MKTATTTIAALAALTLTACGSALLKPQDGSVPALYQPGAAWDEPEQDAAADAAGHAVSASGPTAGGLAPQELPRQDAETWLGDGSPVAGPAPRNAISGGILDVGVVRAPDEGRATVAAPTHGIEPTDSGRLYILELYQTVLEERDALALEVNGLAAGLERAQAEIGRLNGVANADKSAVAALQQELAVLRAENQDLAARLTTAQVRRLEAEKLLLETRIEVQRARIEESTPPASSGIARGEEQP